MTNYNNKSKDYTWFWVGVCVVVGVVVASMVCGWASDFVDDHTEQTENTEQTTATTTAIKLCVLCDDYQLMYIGSGISVCSVCEYVDGL